MNPSTKHSDVHHFPRSHDPVAISSLTAAAIERQTLLVQAKGHRGLYVVRLGNTKARQYIAQEWTTGLEFSFTSAALLQSFLRS